MHSELWMYWLNLRLYCRVESARTSANSYGTGSCSRNQTSRVTLLSFVTAFLSLRILPLRLRFCWIVRTPGISCGISTTYNLVVGTLFGLTSAYEFVSSACAITAWPRHYCPSSRLYRSDTCWIDNNFNTVQSLAHRASFSTQPA